MNTFGNNEIFISACNKGKDRFNFFIKIIDYKYDFVISKNGDIVDSGTDYSRIAKQYEELISL